MTYNEFKLCSILLIKKYEGKLWGEVFPVCWFSDTRKLVSFNTFKQYDKHLFFNESCVARLCWDGRILVFRNNRSDLKLNQKEFLEYFEIYFEDIV